MKRLATLTALTLTAAVLLVPSSPATAAPAPAACNPRLSMDEEEWALLGNGERYVDVNRIVGYSGELIKQGVVVYVYCDVRYPEAASSVRATFTLQGGQWLVSDLVSPWCIPGQPYCEVR